MPTQPKRLADWKSGDPLSAARLNEVQHILRSILRVSAPLQLQSLTGGLYLTMDEAGGGWFGEVVASDLVSTSDYSDARYFVKPVDAATDGSGDDAMVAVFDAVFPAAADSDTITATNIRELGKDTHGLTTGDKVWIFDVPRTGNDALNDHFFLKDVPAGRKFALAKQNWSTSIYPSAGQCRVIPMTDEQIPPVNSDGEITAFIFGPSDTNSRSWGTPNVVSGMVVSYTMDANGKAWIDYPPSAVQDGVAARSLEMWNGPSDSMPSGWVFCNGLLGTPDMRGRVPVGVWSDTGGIPAGLAASDSVGETGDYAAPMEVGGTPFMKNVYVEHDPHGHTTTTCIASQQALDFTFVYTINAATVAAHSDWYDFRQPYTVVGFMMRSDNSITWTGE